MKKLLISFLVLVSLFVVLAIYLVTQYFYWYGVGNESDNRITTIQENNKNILSRYTMQVVTSLKVTDNYKESMVEILEKAMTGRYGNDGSNAVFQFIQEQNLPVDVSSWNNIQALIKAGLLDFENGQSLLLDSCNTYKINVGGLYSGFWLRVVGFPKINLNDICEIVLDDSTVEAFKTKRTKPVI